MRYRELTVKICTSDLYKSVMCFSLHKPARNLNLSYKMDLDFSCFRRENLYLITDYIMVEVFQMLQNVKGEIICNSVSPQSQFLDLLRIA